jgi:hypothetical protein
MLSRRLRKKRKCGAAIPANAFCASEDLEEDAAVMNKQRVDLFECITNKPYYLIVSEENDVYSKVRLLVHCDVILYTF